MQAKRAAQGRAPYARDARFAVGGPPILCRDAQLQMFWVRADPGALRGLLVTNLVEPSGGRVGAEPLGYVLVVAARMPHVESGARPELGVLGEREVSLWVPFRRSVDGRTDGLSFFVPYMFLDAGLALSAGREGLGLPKELARLDAGPSGWTVRAPTVPAGERQAREAELLSIRRDGASGARLPLCNPGRCSRAFVVP